MKLRRLRPAGWISGVVGFVLVLAACGGTADGTASRSKDYGKTWPFTVSSGTLRCDGPGSVTLETSGDTYAINGIASGRASDEGWRDVDEIWANAPDVAGFGTKKNIGAIIDDGLELCDSGDGSMEVSGTPGRIGKDPNEMPSEVEQQAMGLHTFSDFTPAQKDAYVAAYEVCLAEVNAGNYFPDVEGVRDAADTAEPGTGEAAWEGCNDATTGTPITGSGIEPPP